MKVLKIKLKSHLTRMRNPTSAVLQHQTKRQTNQQQRKFMIKEKNPKKVQEMKQRTILALKRITLMIIRNKTRKIQLLRLQMKSVQMMQLTKV